MPFRGVYIKSDQDFGLDIRFPRYDPDCAQHTGWSRSGKDE